jgi:AraC-like DNA-binding protein
MGIVLFNTHDVVLLITAYICSLFAILLLITQKDRRTAHFMLAAFLLTQAAIPTFLLIHYGREFRELALSVSPNLFNFFDLAYWLEGPFLLFYTRSLIYKNYRLKRSDLLYLLPFAAFALHQLFTFFILPHAEKVVLLSDPDTYPGPSYIHYVGFGRELFRVALGLICIWEIRRYRRQLRDQYSDTENLDLSWLRLLTYGFLAVRIWAVFVAIASILEIWGVKIDPGYMGLAGNYTTFLLVSILIFYSLRLSSILKGIEIPEEPNTHPNGQSNINEEEIESLREVMENEKPYLTHSLTLNQLAEQVGVAPRSLSNLINRHFQKSFFEFINYYRVEEAKRLLRSANDASILDTMLDSGFSSKAAFNRFFKKYVGKTPSEYRKSSREAA